MIRNAVHWEFHVPGGIICVHAHVYTDSVRASDALEEQTRQWFRDLQKHLTASELGLKIEPYGKTRVSCDVSPQTPRRGVRRRK